jgi:VRR-NUC domain
MPWRLERPLDCKHKHRQCLNQYDLFRKYECTSCGIVHMCSCEERLAREFLPHQTSRGAEYGTRIYHPVAGFLPNLCPECRGDTEEAHPRAAIKGRKGKIERFYWREITKSYYTFIQEWLATNDEHVSSIIDFQKRFPELSKALRKQARQQWQKAHRANPKYDLSEPTQAQLHGAVTIPEFVVFAEYVQLARGDQKLGRWQDSHGRPVSAEARASESYLSQGWQPHVCERKLITILFATFCFPVIQDANDPLLIIGYRRSTRGWRTGRRDPSVIAIPLPADFGGTRHYERRRAQYGRLFAELQARPLVEAFEERLEPSESLRDYLWVNEDGPVSLARSALRVVPAEDILRWIEWVAADFWHRQPGWPDLLLLSDKAYRFAEVKSPLDELSQEQMRWLRWARTDGRVPCEICRVRKASASR